MQDTQMDRSKEHTTPLCCKLKSPKPSAKKQIQNELNVKLMPMHQNVPQRSADQLLLSQQVSQSVRVPNFAANNSEFIGVCGIIFPSMANAPKQASGEVVRQFSLLWMNCWN